MTEGAEEPQLLFTSPASDTSSMGLLLFDAAWEAALGTAAPLVASAGAASAAAAVGLQPSFGAPAHAPVQQLGDAPGFVASDSQDRLASARERNRLAQRKSREKERQRRAGLQSTAQAMEQEMAALRLENAELEASHRLMEKLLVTRNAMLGLANLLGVEAHAFPPPPEQAAAAAPAAPALDAAAMVRDVAALREASLKLAAAIGQLPSLEQMEQQAAAAAWEELATMPSSSSPSEAVPQAAAAEAAAGGGSPRNPTPAAGAPAPAAGGGSGQRAASPTLLEVLSAANRAGAGGEGLKAVGAPPPDKPVVRQTVQAMENSEALTDYWRRWVAGLRVSFHQAATDDFPPAALTELRGICQDIVEVLWHAAQLVPSVFNAFMVSALPPPEADMRAHQEQVAANSLALLSEAEVATLRLAWQRYVRRMAVAAAGARPWAQRLQHLPAGGDGMALPQVAAQHLQVRELACRLQQACQEQYVATMGLLADVGSCCNIVARCFWHVTAGDYLPDHPAIIHEVLRLHQEQKQALGVVHAAPQLPPAC